MYCLYLLFNHSFPKHITCGLHEACMHLIRNVMKAKHVINWVAALTPWDTGRYCKLLVLRENQISYHSKWFCPLWLPSCRPWSGVSSSTPRWISASPCRQPRKRIVPVLILPDGNMILTRWPNSRSMAECGTKTLWGPWDILHDLLQEEERP